MVETAGNQRTLPIEPGILVEPRFSHDGGRIVFRFNEFLYVHDLARGTNTSFDPWGFNWNPIWSPDDRFIAFASIRPGSDGMDIFRKAADGSGNAESILSMKNNQSPVAWTSDGVSIVYEERGNLRILDVASGRTSSYLETDWNVRSLALSPDEKWAAYQSNETGIWEIYVRTFPEAEERQKVSEGGGSMPRWDPAGGLLYYRRADSVVAAMVRTEPSFTVVDKQAVFAQREGPNAHYDVHPDGGRFVMTKLSEAGTGDDAPRIVVVVNWLEELRRRMGN